MCECVNVLGHKFAQLFAGEQNFVEQYFAQLFVLFSLFGIHCYSKVSVDFNDDPAPLKLGSMMKYVDQDVNCQIHEDGA